MYVDLSILLEVDLSFHLEDVNRTKRIAMNLEATDTVEVQMFNQSCAVTCKQVYRRRYESRRSPKPKLH